MDLDPRECYRVVVAKDRSRSGDFVYAVSTTGTVCKPGCRSRAPLPQHVTYFADIETAVAAGFEPCKRCKPGATARVDSDPELALAAQAMQLLHSGVVEEIGVARTAERLGVDEAHLNRAVARLTGATLANHLLMRRVVSSVDDSSGQWPRQVAAASSTFPATRALRRLVRALLGPAHDTSKRERS
jgi:methylphosphotriester-DNA--protein-cysteine methyltransferase